MGINSNYATTYDSMEMMYPSENLVRIFKGTYPEIQLADKLSAGESILDIGCGDGRHLVFFDKDREFDAYGIEPTGELAEIARKNARDAGAEVTVREGTSRNIPFSDDQFDHLISWNSCYYMGETHEFDFQSHVREYHRVMKPGGTIVLSIPKPTSFIFQDADEVRKGYIEVKNDPFGVRNGSVLRKFHSDEDIVDAFSPQFSAFTVASIHDDFFGFNYHWWILIGEKGE